MQTPAQVVLQKQAVYGFIISFIITHEFNVFGELSGQSF